MRTYTVPMRPGTYVRWSDVGQPEVPITHAGRPLVEVDETRRWWEFVLTLPDDEVHPSIKREARRYLRALRRVA
jgi:hypothetical protein